MQRDPIHNRSYASDGGLLLLGDTFERANRWLRTQRRIFSAPQTIIH